jgi:hypothetical protein
MGLSTYLCLLFYIYSTSILPLILPPALPALTLSYMGHCGCLYTYLSYYIIPLLCAYYLA